MNVALLRISQIINAMEQARLDCEDRMRMVDSSEPEYDVLDIIIVNANDSLGTWKRLRDGITDGQM